MAQKTIATLVGCAIGDALGMPFEMKPAASPMLTGWKGDFQAGGTFWKGEAGQYTDDTLMSIALSESLIECNGFDPAHTADKYLAWYNTGNTRGIGTTTARALVALRMGSTYKTCAPFIDYEGRPVGGNGTAMRAGPIGLVYRNDLNKLLAIAFEDAILTHNSMECKLSSAAVALATAYLANGHHDAKATLEDVLEAIPDSVLRTKLEIVQDHLVNKTAPETALADIGSGGYAPETVAAALYCLAVTDNFKDCVIMSIKCGGDTDTTAAVAGALAGTLYGLEGIPQDYKDKVEDFQMLQDLTDKLVNMKI